MFCISLVLGERALRWHGLKYLQGGITKELDQLFSELARLTNMNSGLSENLEKTAVFLTITMAMFVSAMFYYRFLFHVFLETHISRQFLWTSLHARDFSGQWA